MDPTIELELAKPAESLSLAEMSRNLIEHGLRPRWKPSRILAAIQDPDTVVLVAQTRLGIGGFAVMEFQDIHAHLNLIAVKPGNQRTGIGKALLGWLEESARVAGIENIYLELRQDNEEARKFYESMGYKKRRIVQGYYDGKEDALQMVHELMAPDVAAQRP